MTLIAYLAFGLLIVSFIVAAVRLFLPVPAPLVPALTAFASVLMLVQLIWRSATIGFVALVSTYDGLVFFSLGVALLALAGEVSGWFKQRKELMPAVLFTAVVISAVASSPLVSDAANPPMPALRSVWLVLHVALAFLGEAFFALAFVVSLAWFFTRDKARKRDLDRLVYRSVAIGYPLFTAGAMIFGAIWAEQAWGRYWGWDPKEIWALITWIAYSVYLHLHLRGARYRKAAHITNIAGFLLAMFTFLGVNYLFGGLHSY